MNIGMVCERIKDGKWEQVAPTTRVLLFNSIYFAAIISWPVYQVSVSQVDKVIQTVRQKLTVITQSFSVSPIMSLAHKV